jgi:hypothetical protein
MEDRRDAGAPEAEVADGVGAVGELVDRAGVRQAPDPRVGDRLLVFPAGGGYSGSGTARR